MSFLNNVLAIFILILVSAFFAVSEISLAASRKIKLKLLLKKGDHRPRECLTCRRTRAIISPSSRSA